MRLIVWALRLFLFFALFAFALNNEQTVTLNWFFGYQWRAPMVIVVLGAVALGAMLGVTAMLPMIVRRRRIAPPSASDSLAPEVPGERTPPAPASTSADVDHPPRIGL